VATNTQATEEDVGMVAAATALARGAADGGKAARSARGLDSGVKRSKKGASHPREMELLLAATRKLSNAQAWCDLRPILDAIQATNTCQGEGRDPAPDWHCIRLACLPV